ncbi:MAG: TetR/AcrR family transcriptional regulator [Novosphingobium sp.]|nr:TetR/AcrR family transcriptional regulator [Novosphingobium sp.]
MAVETDKRNGNGIGQRNGRILAAADSLLTQGGLEGLTIRAVLAETGLARRAFYESFPNKDDLVLAVFAETIRLAAAHYIEGTADVASPLERLRIIVTSLGLGGATGPGVAAENTRRSTALSREHLRLAEARPAQLQQALAPLLSLIAREIAAGIAAGEVRPADPERLAALIYNLVATTIHTELIAEEGSPPDPARRERLAADVWEFCRRAIEAPAA